MLTVTEQAARMIRELIDHSDLSEGAGLRIAQRDDHPALAMTLVEEPNDLDVIVAEHDVAVFLGPVAAVRTEGQVLDATSDSHSAFYLRG